MSVNHESAEVLAHFKIVIIGSSGVGKSCVLERCINDTFDGGKPVTIGVDYYSKIVTLSDFTIIQVSFWDTAGQERFRTLTPSFYRGAHGAVVVFDLGSRASFDSLEKWFEEAAAFCNKPNIVRLLIGNKLDLDTREVTQDEALRFARRRKVMYAEVSAKMNEGVNKAFQELYEKIYSSPDLWLSDGLTEAGALRLSLKSDSQPKSACGCS